MPDMCLCLHLRAHIRVVVVGRFVGGQALANNLDDFALLGQHPHLPDPWHVPLGRVWAVLWNLLCLLFL